MYNPRKYICITKETLLKKLVLYISVLCSMNDLQAQTRKEPLPFPFSFVGNWKGKLQWMVSGKPDQEFSMQLKIHPADTAGQYTWRIIYGDAELDDRHYLLKPVDSTRGHWAIDERDGIILDSYVHGNAFHGAFTVQGNTIIDNYKLENGKLYVEFFTVRLNDMKTSGKGTEETPFVNSYRIGGYQSGVLLKVD